MIQGAGVGLRQAHFQAILENRPPINWFEILADQYLFSQGLLIEKLQQVLSETPRVMHCTGLSIGGVDPLDDRYMKELRRLVNIVQPVWVSDHLSVSRIQGRFYPELLPIPYTKASLDNVCRRVDQVQNYLQRPILLENAVVYAVFKQAEFSEADFLAEVFKKTGCGVLLDINNLYVNQVNHGIDPGSYFEALPRAAVKQMHLAGYSVDQGFLIDTHSQPVQAGVWPLYRAALGVFPAVPTCLEWDSDLPTWSVFAEEVAKISELLHAP